MNPNREPSEHEPDDTLDRLIRAATAQPPPMEVRQRVIEIAASLTPNSRRLRWRGRRRSWFLAAAVAVTVAAASVMVFLLLPSASFGWEDVTKAVKLQPWICATTTWEGRKSTMWLSPQRQIWAFRRDNWFIFADGHQRARYEYRADGQRVIKTALGEEGARLVSPVDYVTQGLWLFGTERVVSQQRREVTQDGKKWIEFDLVFWRGEMNLGTLHVDPVTRLPVYLLLRSRTDVTKSMRYDFTYPSDGPADIYALGIPAGTRIDDRMPPSDAQRVLDAVAAARARLGDFRVIVTGTRQGPIMGGHPSFIVWRKGDRWRIDTCAPEAQIHWAARPPDGQGWGNPSVEQLKLSWMGPLYLCDGRTVYINANPPDPNLFDFKPQPVVWQPDTQNAPRDLLSGDSGSMSLAPHVRFASLVYPDLSPVPGWGFEFDPKPAAAPGCVLIKRSARLATIELQRGHEWYYLDSAKGYALVRAERFNLPADAPADSVADAERQVVRLEEFQQSPQGFWYPRVFHETMPVMSAANQKAGGEGRQLSTVTVHYHFDFSAALPDWLFAMEDASKLKK